MAAADNEELSLSRKIFTIWDELYHLGVIQTALTTTSTDALTACKVQFNLAKLHYHGFQLVVSADSRRISLVSSEHIQYQPHAIIVESFPVSVMVLADYIADERNEPAFTSSACAYRRQRRQCGGTTLRR